MRGAKRHHNLTIILLALAVAVLLYGYNPRGSLPFVSLRSSTGPLPGNPAPQDPPKPVLRVGIAAVTSPRATLRHYDALLVHMGEVLDHQIIVVQRQTYTEMNDLIESGEVDMAFVCTYAYVKGQAEFGLELLAAPVIDGSPEYFSYLIVPGGSQATSLLDLKGRMFAFTDPLSLSGYLVPVHLLKEAGQTPDELFRNHIFTYSHDNSINAVAQRLVDGAHVDSLVYDLEVARDPSLATRVKIVSRIGPFGSPPVVVRPDLDAGLKERVQSFLLGLQDTGIGRELLRQIAVDRFVVPDGDLYEEVRSIAGQVMEQ
jgi:phosphonate transport system substrate-binding protein